MRYISARNHYCECGQLETVEQFLKMCTLNPTMWDSLRKVPLKLDTNIIIDTKKGLETIAKFLDLLPQLFCW